MMKKSAIAILLCIGLASATLTIPLKSQKITMKENDVDVVVDNVTYVDAKITKIANDSDEHVEKLLLDVATDVNFIISRDTQYNDKEVSIHAPSCSEAVKEGTAETNTVAALCGKVTLKGGSTLKKQSHVSVEESFEDVNIYVPAKVGATTLASNVEILKFAHGALSLGRKRSSLAYQLDETSKQVDSKQYSVYFHDQISQLNVGGAQEYFLQPGAKNVEIPCNTKANWQVTVSDIIASDKSVLGGATLGAHFDLTSQYTYIPHSEANPNDPNSVSKVYFMNEKDLPCFQPNNNLANKLSYICKNFPGYDSYKPITFLFKTNNAKQPFKVVLNPEDYIQETANGHELLFRFTSAPQTSYELYLGTSFLKKFYTTFSIDKGSVTFGEKFVVPTPANGTHINNDYNIPFIVVGAILALASVIALLVILKKVTVEHEAVELTQVPVRSVEFTPVTAYQPLINTQYNPVVGTVYNSGINQNTFSVPSNTIVASNPLRQSQNLIRQSQNITRNSQNFVIKQTF